MNSEIKQRIKQIKNGEIPDGYRSTKAGVLPKWDCVHLNQIAEPITKKVGNGTYETLSISAGIGFVNQAKKFGKELSGKQYEKYTVLNRGDFSYNKGNSKSYLQGCIYRLKDRETAAVPNVFESFKIKNDSPDYYEQLFTSGYLNKQLSKKINHGVRDNGLLNLTEKDFYSCYVPHPPIAEQQKIAEILMQCDKLIELYQNETDELQKLKKICLCNMFPKNGNDIPKWRFPQFTDAWEQRKLGNALISLQNNTLARADLSNETGLAKNVHYGDVLIKFGEVLDVSKAQLPMIADEKILTKYKASFLQNGDVIVADTAEDTTVGKCSEIVGLNDEVVLSGLHTIPYRPVEKFAAGYLGYYLNSSAYHNQLIPLMQGIKVTSISKSAMQDTDIVYPKSKEEQAKIGVYFRNLDNIITLHQRKLAGMEKQKKSLTQLLLTGIVRVSV